MANRNQFKYAILITYRDMESGILPGFVAKANFFRVQLDSGTKEAKSLLKGFADPNQYIPTGDTLKIFISGHAATGIQYITDNSGNLKMSIDDLVDILADGLRLRCTSKATAWKTQINMIACEFGRTPDGSVGSSSAEVLHRKLADKGVYVELVARTESINHIVKDGDPIIDSGRQTISPVNEKFHKSKNERPSRYKPQRSYTKILCYFPAGGNSSAVLKSYSGTYLAISADHLKGRQFLWAENVVNELVKYINFSNGKVEDERQNKMWEIVRSFDTSRDPEVLKREMEKVVSGEGDDVRENFTIYPWGDGWFSSLSAKPALLINDLLSKYPR